MKKRRRSKNDLMAYAERFAISLIHEASGGSIGKPLAVGEDGKPIKADAPLGDRRAVLDSIVKLIAMKNRFEPEEEEPGFNSMRSFLNDRPENKNGGDFSESHPNGKAE